MVSVVRRKVNIVLLSGFHNSDAPDHGSVSVLILILIIKWVGFG